MTAIDDSLTGSLENAKKECNQGDMIQGLEKVWSTAGELGICFVPRRLKFVFCLEDQGD